MELPDASSVDLCAICTEAAPPGDADVAVCAASALTRRGHGFHVQCLALGLLVDSRCPVCRADMSLSGYAVGPEQLPHLPRHL